MIRPQVNRGCRSLVYFISSANNAILICSLDRYAL